jgi:hypothetical protein
VKYFFISKETNVNVEFESNESISSKMVRGDKGTGTAGPAKVFFSFKCANSEMKLFSFHNPLKEAIICKLNCRTFSPRSF